MGETTAISWADKTFNGWIGCARVGPGCDNCYAADLMGTEGRYKRAVWGGPGAGTGTRVRTSAANWKEPLRWNRKAEKDGTRPFVFCSSLADVFDNAVPVEWRRDLFDLIRSTPHLTWLLLTKRPGNVLKLFEEACRLNGDGTRWTSSLPALRLMWPRNAALGCTVVNQDEADRDIPKLIDATSRLRPAFTFLSIEPLLGPVDLSTIVLRRDGALPTDLSNRLGDYIRPLIGNFRDSPKIDWIITGGESGSNARIMDPRWVRPIRDQCADAGTAFHHKQNGEFVAGTGEQGRWIYPVNGDAESVVWSLRRSVDIGGGWFADRVGKKRAGRSLDGEVHDARPALPPLEIAP